MVKKYKKWGQPLTYDNLSKSLHTFALGFYHSLLSFKTSGLLWPLRKSSAFFILYPRCSDSNPSNTCNKCHMSRADPKSFHTFPFLHFNRANLFHILYTVSQLSQQGLSLGNCYSRCFPPCSFIFTISANCFKKP